MLGIGRHLGGNMYDENMSEKVLVFAPSDFEERGVSLLTLYIWVFVCCLLPIKRYKSSFPTYHPSNHTTYTQ